jgi:NTP pyrophosphatase (non-canonical NTP hydrolase)
MRLSEYQSIAQRTDQTPEADLKGVLVPLLGLAGEVGSLLVEYKKHLRDGEAHRLFREQIGEDLGDLLWYVANVATKFGLDLDQIAEQNLVKTQGRWGDETPEKPRLFDEGRPSAEQLPRHFEIRVVQTVEDGRAKVECWWDELQVGDYLTDNAYEDDGYRFHDVFHFAYAALLGWSPILRKHMKRRRRSDPVLNEVEDGGRAKVIEEAVSALVYDYAKKHAYLKEVKSLDYPLLKTVHALVADREVGTRTLRDWEAAILTGYDVWREVRSNRGGIVIGDLDQRTLVYRLS